MKPVSILLAEDDPHIRQGLIDTLESEGYQVSAAPDGGQAWASFQESSFDLVILDIMMPQMNGYDVCRLIRSKDKRVPIIMLTAKGEEVDKVVGLELGADDYVTKPFGVRELLARISAVLRRSRGSSGEETKKDLPAVFRFGDGEVDRRQYKLRSGTHEWDLSSRELRLMDLFFSHPQEVLSRDELLNQAWGIEYYGTTRTLDQHIAQLRKKVESDPAHPRFIVTAHGVGYRYCPDLGAQEKSL